MLDPVSGAGAYLITGGIADRAETAGGATAENSGNLTGIEGLLNDTSFIPNDVGTGFIPASPPAVEKTMQIDQEVTLTQNYVTIHQNPVNSINSLSPCELELLANAQSGAELNDSLWQFPLPSCSSPLGTPIPCNMVPSLNPFVFDAIQERLRQLREQGISCQ